MLPFKYGLLAAILTITGCGATSDSTDASTDETTESAASEDKTDVVSETVVLSPNNFSTANLISDFTLVDCTLSDGTQTQCYSVTFGNSPQLTGSLCPKTINDTGGVGIYDGPTDPGLHVLNAELWAIFAADGFDIVDADGNVNVVVPDGPPGGGVPGAGMPDGGPPDGSLPDGEIPDDAIMDSAFNGSCLEAELIEDLQLTYTIPATPSYQTNSATAGATDFRGVLLDGFPLAAPPPATVNGDQAAIPALDACGGHPQPAGPYHWHIVPQESNHVLDASGIDEVVCNNVTQTSTQLIGYASDGFPIYGSLETDGSTSTALDECRGHVGSTSEFSDGIYHYHISATDIPNTLTCLHGATVSSTTFLEYQ